VRTSDGIAAFHNESHHPHVHLMVYSAKDNDGYLTEPAIEAMRSEIAHDIFRQDFANIYEQQNAKQEASLKQGCCCCHGRAAFVRLHYHVLVKIELIEEKMVLLSQTAYKTQGEKKYMAILKRM
jgi:hypothetical protein